MKKKSLPPPHANTIRFIDFAPYRLICRCASCVHRKNSKITDAEGSVILCAKKAAFPERERCFFF